MDTDELWVAKMQEKEELPHHLTLTRIVTFYTVPLNNN